MTPRRWSLLLARLSPARLSSTKAGQRSGGGGRLTASWRGHMASKWRITIYLRSGAVAVAEAQDIRIGVDEHGDLAEFELTHSEGPRLAYVGRPDVSAVVVENLQRPTT
jgi:hypothetical protein